MVAPLTRRSQLLPERDLHWLGKCLKEHAAALARAAYWQAQVDETMRRLLDASQDEAA